MRIVEPKFTKHSLAVINQRYAKLDEHGNPAETAGEMFWRVAKALAEPEIKWANGKPGEKIAKKYAKRFYSMFVNKEFCTGGRVLFEAGNTHTGMLSSCFVVPIEDSLDSIFDALKNAAIIIRSGGGTGFNFSNIRPAKARVKGVKGIAAGPIHYIKTYDQAFSELLQGSKRHGGNMGILNVDHPDIAEFINLKRNKGTIINFNLSVGVTDDFMQKVKQDKEYELINPHTGIAEERISARQIFSMMTESAWESAEPGIIFLDALQRGNTVPGLGTIEATNPCGEQPLLPYEACNLGSILPHNFVNSGKIDWKRLEEVIRLATRLMDNMIDINKLPLAQISDNVNKTRKIGLGVLGLAHLFYKLGIPYNSQEALDLAEKLMMFIYKTALNESSNLAKQRGIFPAWRKSIYAKKGIKVRNACVTSIAPTGTISIIQNTSGGIEPVFSLVTKRRMFWEKERQDEYFIVDPVFEEVAKKEGFYSEELLRELAQNGSLRNITGIPEKIKNVFVTAYDIEPQWHIKMQAVIQKGVDSGVSKTINLPEEATVRDVKDAYMMAWELGCKGVAVYRDKSISGQVLSTGK